ncbi:hypothetical protein ACIG54_35725 [Streptomyces achromogenes]|uniref:hypothetical protein n=1 Tax=Streptomyces achromogenes TaxID=67255 RepID=UPI002284B122|nr:hypothetical protein [Streptomyces sp. UMAF16]
MNTKGMAKKALTATAVAVSAVALSTAPAFAGSNGHAYTDFESCSVLGTGCVMIETGEGWFTADGDKWKACDLYADGMRVVVEARWTSGGATHIYPAIADQGKGTCDTYSKDIPEGTKVSLKIWRQKGADGTPKDVTSFSGTA